MTNEEAIKVLNMVEAHGLADEAKRMAIEVLQAKTDGDLISRQDAVNEIHKYFVEEIDKTPTEIDEDGDELYTDMPTVNSLLACNKELSKRIKSLPSAEPKTGEWVDDCACSICHWIHEDNNGFALITKYNFCPNCGADMRGEKEHGSCE